MTDDQHQDRDRRWPRLAARIIMIGAAFALGSFVMDCVDRIWGYGLTTSGLSGRLLGLWVAKALGVGLFFGLFMGIPEWLVLEKSIGSNRNSPK